MPAVVACPMAELHGVVEGESFSGPGEDTAGPEEGLGPSPLSDGRTGVLVGSLLTRRQVVCTGPSRPGDTSRIVEVDVLL